MYLLVRKRQNVTNAIHHKQESLLQQMHLKSVPGLLNTRDRKVTLKNLGKWPWGSRSLSLLHPNPKSTVVGAPELGDVTDVLWLPHYYIYIYIWQSYVKNIT